MRDARELDIPIWSEVELGYRLLAGQPLIGVTGTNGKTTTAELIGAMLAEAGVAADVVGNVGRPLSAVAGELSPETWVVCELSSFQLEDVHTFRADIGVLLNVTPDHLDRHHTMEAYERAKLRLFERQGPDEHAVVPRGYGPIPGDATRHEFAGDDPLPAEPLIPGPHNRENAAAATVVGRVAGVSEPALATALATFSGVEHRLEHIRTLAGVRYVNDSKATNPSSAQRAIETYPESRLILGGSLKGTSFDDVAKAARLARVKRCYLIGEAAAELAPALAAEDVDHLVSGTLGNAVESARGDAAPGDVVLLSPACASYDQFTSFEERGERFRSLVEAL